MYLHLGRSAVVEHRDIVGIFDLDNVSNSSRTREFLTRAEEEGRLETLGGRIPAALVVCADRAYLSPLSAQNLQKRAGDNLLENGINLK